MKKIMILWQKCFKFAGTFSKVYSISGSSINTTYFMAIFILIRKFDTAPLETGHRLNAERCLEDVQNLY